MKLNSKLNAKVRKIVSFKETDIFTDEYCKNLTKKGFDDLQTPLGIIGGKEPSNLVRRDSDGKVNNEIKLGLIHKGLLKDQTAVEKNCLYKALHENKYIDVLCITSGSWTRGTEVPDVKFKPFNYKNLKRG